MPMFSFKVELDYPSDFLFRYGTFGCLASFQPDMLERMAGAVDKSALIGLVVNGANLFYIEINRIGIVFLLLPEFDESLHRLFRQDVESYFTAAVPFLPELSSSLILQSA